MSGDINVLYNLIRKFFLFYQILNSFNYWPVNRSANLVTAQLISSGNHVTLIAWCHEIYISDADEKTWREYSRMLKRGICQIALITKTIKTIITDSSPSVVDVQTSCSSTQVQNVFAEQTAKTLEKYGFQ